MAFVPEIDDPNKKDEDPNASDIQSQTMATSTPSAAPVTGAPAPGGNPAASATKSSGNFQDFSKFKAANQNKLSALSNLTLGQADKTVADAGSAFQNAGSAFQKDIQKNAKNFETSDYPKLNKDSTIDADQIGADLEAAGQKVDVGSFHGKLAGDQSFTGLQSAENTVANIGNRAGTAKVLGSADTFKNSGASVGAANSDALLLQSMGNYRTAANQKAQAAKGTTDQALSEQQTKLSDTAKSVDTQNQEYKRKALEKLGAVKGEIDSDVAAAVDKGESARQVVLDAKIKELDQKLKLKRDNTAAKLYTTPPTPPPSTPPPPPMPPRPDPNPTQPPTTTTITKMFMGRPLKPEPNPNYATEKAEYDAKIAEAKRMTAMTPEQLRQEAGASDAVGQLRAGRVTADSVVNSDPERQAQLAALSRILGDDLGGTQYGTGGVAPATDMSPLEQLIASISVPETAKPTQAPSAGSSGGGSSRVHGQPTKVRQNERR